MLTNDLHKALRPLLASYDPQQIVVVTGQDVNACRPEIAALGYPVLTMQGGEENKSIVAVQRIWDFLLEHNITRRGLLICFGGGIVTDLGGFAASTYKRGLNYINIPTTLLAMVDASTGGKTGFNYAGLKNCIGSFCAPVETIICPPLLDTLSAEQLLSGYAEMLKTALLDGPELFNALLQYDLDTMPVADLAPLIGRCLTVKERIVQSDPHEKGLRKALNLGHTVGHALEELGLQPSAISHQPSENRQSSNRQLLHGYAVLYGLIAELYLSVVRLGMSREPLQQLTQLMLHYYGRPQCKCSDREHLIALMEQDKKNERTTEINCTLIHSIGQPAINQVISRSEMNEALDYLFSL